MDLTGKQVRAARALAGWDRPDLAEKAGFSLMTIQNIELETKRPKQKTIDRIIATFDEVGIEFLEDQGVRFRPEGVEVLNGRSGLAKFFDLVFAYAQTCNEGIIRQNGIEERMFDRFGGDITQAHRSRMAPLVNTRKNIFVRAILSEGDMNFVCTNYADYRWLSKAAPSPVPYYIFGDNIAIFAFVADPPPKIVLISSPVIAQAYSTQFDQTWDMAVIPPNASKARGQ